MILTFVLQKEYDDVKYSNIFFEIKEGLFQIEKEHFPEYILEKIV